MRIELAPEQYATLCAKAKKERPDKIKFLRETPGTGSQILQSRSGEVPRNFGRSAFVGFNKSAPAVPQTD